MGLPYTKEVCEENTVHIKARHEGLHTTEGCGEVIYRGGACCINLAIKLPVIFPAIKTRCIACGNLCTLGLTGIGYDAKFMTFAIPYISESK
jgi:hypothetical protein